MDRITPGQGEEKSSSGVELRRDARFRVSNPNAFRVVIKLALQNLEATCFDYSPFGMGLRIAVRPNLPLFSIGEVIDLECDFLGSKFNARGVIANTRIENSPMGDFVRLGISLSRTGEIVRSTHIKRRSARIQINESVAPLAIASDELRFGESVFAKMTDISKGGMRLLIDRHPLPFMEKQKHWFEVLLPIFGSCRAYCRISYVRRDEAAQKYIVGCEFLDGGKEQELRPVEDWLFYTNSWLNADDIKKAGFALAHIAKEDEKYRILVNSSDMSAPELVSPQNPSDEESLEFTLVDGAHTHKLSATYAPATNDLRFDSVSIDSDSEAVKQAFWKAILVFSLHNNVKSLKIEKDSCSSRFLKDTLSEKKEQGHLEVQVRDIISSDALKWGLWRKVYGELKVRSELKLPEPTSFIRRLFLF